VAVHPRYQATPFGRWIVVAASVALVFTMHASPVQAAAIEPLSGCAANTLLANDDESTGAVNLGFNANFFGPTYSSVYINNNGNVTFVGPLGEFTPQPLVASSTPIIAPFWADVDTSAEGSGVVTYGQTTFGGRPALCVNWDGVGVGYYSGHIDKLNKFQLLLVGRADLGAGAFDIIFNYDQIQWETGDASGGTGGLGGDSARAGFSNGNPETPATSYELPGSAVNGGFLDTNPTTGLANNTNTGNVDLAGRYVYPVRGGTTTPDDTGDTVAPGAADTVQTAPDGVQFSILSVPAGGPGGEVTMHEGPGGVCPLVSPATCVGQQLDLTAPSATSPAAPLVLKILVAKTAVNARLSIKNALMLHDDTQIALCDKRPRATASPAPCLSSIKGMNVGGVAYWQYLVYAVDNGSWRPGIIPR
jgi:hypothetical protein